FNAKPDDFKKIPGSPIAYWVSDKVRNSFSTFPNMGSLAVSSNGVQTGNNNNYVRSWNEINITKLNLKWFPYNKGGSYRKWYGNYEFLVDWEFNGRRIKSESNSCTRGEEYYLKLGITWSDVTSGKLAGRLLPEGFLFDAAGPSAFYEDKKLTYIGLGLLNTKFADYWSKIL
ncbi:BREX-1 system adenine-specific DNA-methyltransferase PglX, partial [Acinetobacter bohemicus]